MIRVRKNLQSIESQNYNYDQNQEEKELPSLHFFFFRFFLIFFKNVFLF